MVNSDVYRKDSTFVGPEETTSEFLEDNNQIASSEGSLVEDRLCMKESVSLSVNEQVAKLLSVEQQLAEYLRISHSGRVQDLRLLSHWVFVYGTLKRSFPNSHLLEDGALFEGDFMTCDKYPLVIGGPYYSPYLLDMKGYGNNVRGELYRVSSESLKELDKLENVGVNYTRRVIPIYSVKDRSFIVKAFAYLKCNYTDELLQTKWLSDYQDRRYVPRQLRPKDDNAQSYRKTQSMQDIFSADSSANCN
ncbi:Gamma-glutamylaminecyclotransferase [Galdieria sulphuraria]|nr:Gamma-glutamylaminecyclotransferase [Galdieria sulphuraria]